MAIRNEYLDEELVASFKIWKHKMYSMGSLEKCRNKPMTYIQLTYEPNDLYPIGQLCVYKADDVISHGLLSLIKTSQFPALGSEAP